MFTLTTINASQYMKWNLDTVGLEQIRPHPKNPRQLTKANCKGLKSLITKFGLIDKPILNYDLTIIGGHQRVQILIDSGETKCECWVASRQLSAEEEEELMIGLNHYQGEWDTDKLANLFDEDFLKSMGLDKIFTDEAPKKRAKPAITISLDDASLFQELDDRFYKDTNKNLMDYFSPYGKIKIRGIE